MNKEMLIRNSTLDDFKQIAELEAIWCPAGASYEDFSDFYQKKSERDFLDVIVSNENPEDVLGFIGFQFHKEERKAHIWNLAVFPIHRRLGLGKKLIEHSLEVARKRDSLSVHLEVSEFNQSALSLYRSLGFVESSHEENYYGSGEGCFHLVYELEHS